MIATLIPYLLVCNISGDSTWPYGPEFVYNGEVNFTINSVSHPSTVLPCSMVVHCRPRNEHTLSCVFKNITVGFRVNENSNYEDITDPARFEIHFNKMGVENITVPNEISMMGSVFVRFFTSLVTVGFDMSGKTDQDGVFQVTNPIQDPYKMNVKIEYPVDTEYNRTNDLYELEVLTGINEPVNKTIEITKRKVPDGVFRLLTTAYLPFGDKPTLFMQRVEIADNRIKISKHAFESYTHETGVLRATDRDYYLFYDGFINIKLTNVVPADEPIQDVVEPTTFSVLE